MQENKSGCFFSKHSVVYIWTVKIPEWGPLFIQWLLF